MESMKTSDKKKYEKAWETYYTETGNLIVSLDTINNLPEKELRVDEINQISTCVGKMSKVINRICDCHNVRREQ